MRRFAKISAKRFSDKLDSAMRYNPSISYRDYYELFNSVKSDIYVKFDLENLTTSGEFGPKTLCGLNKIGDLLFFGICAGGDWEFPVFSIIYWDGKKLRGYIPTKGNPFNNKTNHAYGNDNHEDKENSKLRWPEIYSIYEYDWPYPEDFEPYPENFEHNEELIKQDIISAFGLKISENNGQIP